MEAAPSQQMSHISITRDVLKGLEPTVHEVVIAQIVKGGSLNPSVSSSSAPVTIKGVEDLWAKSQNNPELASDAEDLDVGADAAKP